MSIFDLFKKRKPAPEFKTFPQNSWCRLKTELLPEIIGFTYNDPEAGPSAKGGPINKAVFMEPTEMTHRLAVVNNCVKLTQDEILEYGLPAKPYWLGFCGDQSKEPLKVEVSPETGKGKSSSPVPTKVDVKILTTQQQVIDLLNKGAGLEQGNSLDAALGAYDEAIQLVPKMSMPYARKGRLLVKLGDRSAALSCYDKALELNTGRTDALNDKGIILRESKQPEEALKIFEKLLKINPDHAQAWYNKGATLSDMEQFEEAIKSFQQAVRRGYGMAVRALEYCNSRLEHKLEDPLKGLVPIYPVGVWMRMQIPFNKRPMIGYTFMNPGGEMYIFGGVEGDPTLAHSPDLTLPVPKNVGWAWAVLSELEINAMQLPATPKWLTTQGPQPAKGTLFEATAKWAPEQS